MSIFLSEHEALIDKSRVLLPASYRKQLAEGDREQLICRFDPDLNCLKLFPVSVFLEESAKILEKFSKRGDKNIQQQYFANSEYIDIDSVGRILLNKKLKELIDVDNLVLFVGGGNHINIYKKETYEGGKHSLKALEDALDAKS